MPFTIFCIFKKQPFEHHFRAAGSQKPSTSNSGWRTRADPAFHETIVTTVPLRLTGFQNVVLGMKMCSISICSCFPMCLFFIHFPITLFQKPKVILQPFCRPFFDANQAAFEQLCFCNCPSSCLFVFFCYFPVDFLILVSAPWPNMGRKSFNNWSILLDFVTPFGSTRPKNTYKNNSHILSHTHTPTDEQPTTQQTIVLKTWPGGMRVSD